MQVTRKTMIIVRVLGYLLLAMATAERFTASAAAAEESRARTTSGTFVSFKNGMLTIKRKSGLIVFKQVDANYKTYQDNDPGAGSKLVDTTLALSKVAPGMAMQVNVEDREIRFGLDYRVIGAFESYQDGTLIVQTLEAPPGSVTKPTGTITLAIDRALPVLKSIDGGDFKFAGEAQKVLPQVSKGVIVTARSESDPAIVDVIELGEPKRRVERYAGQSRGTVRGGFVSWKDGILRIRGKGISPLAAIEYERVIAARIGAYVPIFESIDGGEYQPVTSDALKNLREGTTVTIRKAEEIVIEVFIGVTNKK